MIIVQAFKFNGDSISGTRPSVESACHFLADLGFYQDQSVIGDIMNEVNRKGYSVVEGSMSHQLAIIVHPEACQFS